MQKIQSSLLLLALLGIMSFTDLPYKDAVVLETITYSTCSCETAQSSAPKVALTLNPDHTFHYLNASDPAHPVDQKGAWVMLGKSIVLKSDAAKANFHKTWNLDKNKSCVVSRKGLNFIRLCDVKACD